MNQLPRELSNALEQELAPIPVHQLKKACSDLTQNYLHGRGVESSLHAYAYIAARLPATYGVASQIFKHLPPSLLTSSHTLLDLGAGVGSLAWLAVTSLPQLQHITLWEKNQDLMALGKRLLRNLPSAPPLSWCQADITSSAPFPSHDLLVISYVLNELPPPTRADVLKRAYLATGKALILIEPGTPQGFKSILKARETLLNLGAHLVAPCPHQAPCPLLSAVEEGKDWCHFSVRLPRGRPHKQVKNATLPYEDEKYTYLVVSPGPFPLPEGRLIRPPLRRSGHIIVDICSQEGEIKRRVLSKKEGKPYIRARTSTWGDEWAE